MPTKAELRSWIHRFEEAEQLSKSARSYVPVPASQSFDKSLELMRLADECGTHTKNSNPSDEDLKIIATWNRLRKAGGSPRGGQ